MVEKNSQDVTIRRLVVDDVKEVLTLCKTVQEEAAKEELLIQLRQFFFHPYLYVVTFLSMGVLYYILQVDLVTATFTVVPLFSITEAFRFHLYWKKIRRVFGKGQDLKELFPYYSHPKRFFLVAVVNGEIAGTVAVKETEETRVAKLFRVFTQPRFRRRGIASRLISASHEECKKVGYTTVSLRTHITNGKATKCYEKAGYSLIGKKNFASLYPHSLVCVEFIKKNL